MTSRNWEHVKKRFPGYTVFRDGHHYIQRDYAKIPKDPRDQTGLGSIAYDSEDLMLLLRLFKPGDIGFEGQVIQTPEGPWNQYRYPQAFSGHHSVNHYILNSNERAKFNTFLTETQSWPGWNSLWFNISRRYFLWGSFKEFNIMREGIEKWELERILDFFIALEAAFVPENDFVGQRLRERAAALLSLDVEVAKALKKRLTALYGIRSAIAHGGVIKKSQVKTLRNDMPHFEKDVRDLLKAVLQGCPVDEQCRLSWLKALYDISDQDRVDKLKEDFESIKTDALKQKLLRDLSNG